MKIEDRYRIKMASVEELVSLVKSGDHVWFPGSGCSPWGFLDALLKREDVENVSFCHPTAWGAFPYGKQEYQGRFRCKSLFLSANARKAWKGKWGIDVIPVRLSAVSDLIEENHLPVDCLVLNLSPPDESGFCSMGPYSAYMNNAIKKAKVIMGQINEQMPRTFGDNRIHVDTMDYLFEHSQPLLGTGAVDVGPVEQQIAQWIEPLIQDGDTLQIGRGSVPQAIVQLLDDKKDLGVHSEMISDWIVDLMEKGVVTGLRKSHLPGVAVAAFGDGTQRFYDFVHQNKKIEFRSSGYVNDPRVIAQNDQFVSINSAVQIDLTGQINAESVKTQLISGVGGQMDFALGAQWSRNGRYIVAMPSTAMNGMSSRILPVLPEGTAVTIPRSLADMVVTEYGVAKLKGKTLEERMDSLIAIAHPSFRDSLEKQAEELLFRQR